MKITELVNAIELRPLHFLRAFSFQEFDTFLRGYKACLFHLNPNNQDFDTFILWLKVRFSPKDYPDWTDYFMEGRNDEKALSYFFDVWKEFIVSQIK